LYHGCKGSESLLGALFVDLHITRVLGIVYRPGTQVARSKATKRAPAVLVCASTAFAGSIVLAHAVLCPGGLQRRG